MTGEGTYHKTATVLGINKDDANIDITTVKEKVTYRESNSYVKNAVALVSNTVSACSESELNKIIFVANKRTLPQSFAKWFLFHYIS